MNKPALQSQNTIEIWRYFVFYGAIALVIGYYLLRLFTLQIIEGEKYRTRSEDNRTNEISVPTQRGLIYDRNGFVLARNIGSYNVVVTPADLPADPGTTQEIYRQLSAVIGVPVNNGETNDETVRNFSPCVSDLGITQIVEIGDSLAPYDPVPVKCYVDERVAMLVRERSSDWPGVSIQVDSIRDYPTGNITSEIIGFLGPIPALEKEYWESLGFVANRDKVGYAGVEQSLNDILIGKNGLRIVEVDNAGQIMRDLQPPQEPIPGFNVRLTIDTRLQSAAKAALKDWMSRQNTRIGQEKYKNGVVIAMNPKTGEILALVSEPTFENNRMARLIPAYYYNQLQSDPLRPLFNHAISAEHPPGSVFKMAAAIGILNEGVVTTDQKINDPGKISIEEKFFENDPNPRSRDYVCYIYKTTNGGHGDLDYFGGVAESCDVYFYKVGGGYQDEVPQGLGIWRLGEYAKALGYGSPTGIELPGEENGIIPDPTWKRLTQGENWSTGDTYISTMGQGYITSTPLQVLVSFATLANDGKYMKPTLVREVLDNQGNIIKPFEPQMIWDITKDPVIGIYDENFILTEERKSVEPWVVKDAQIAMREVVVRGTAKDVFEDFAIPTAGKTGTAEYCDNQAQLQNLCEPGKWPAHAWYAGYAPFDDPEIAVVAFVYNGDEGAVLAAPVVRKVMEAYFELKSIDTVPGETNLP